MQQLDQLKIPQHTWDAIFLYRILGFNCMEQPPSLSYENLFKVGFTNNLPRRIFTSVKNKNKKKKKSQKIKLKKHFEQPKFYFEKSVTAIEAALENLAKPHEHNQLHKYRKPKHASQLKN